MLVSCGYAGILAFLKNAYFSNSELKCLFFVNMMIYLLLRCENSFYK